MNTEESIEEKNKNNPAEMFVNVGLLEIPYFLCCFLINIICRSFAILSNLKIKIKKIKNMEKKK